jgi:nitrite reductase/ring-hydroxylating ferredoxin subunit
MKKILNRRAFIVGCGLLTFSSAGVFFTGCGESNSSNDDQKKDNYTKSSNKKVKVENTNKSITMTQADLDTLKSRGYINVANEQLLVFYDKNIFYGFSNVCPHENGELKIENETKIRCQKHTNQTFSDEGATNRARTSSNLRIQTLSIKVS